MAVAAVLEPGLGVDGRDEVHCGLERLIDPVAAPCASPCEPPLDLGPSQFDRFEVRGVGWQVGDLGTGRFNQGPDLSVLVGSEVVHDDKVIVPEFGDEDVFDVRDEDVSGRAALHAQPNCPAP